MDKTKLIKFTPTEWEMITDRPVDCISDCLEHEPISIDNGWTRELIENKAEEMFSNKDRIVDISDPLTLEVLKDAVCGNMLLEMMEDDVYNFGYHDPSDPASSQTTREALAKYRRAAKTIEKKTTFSICGC